MVSDADRGFGAHEGWVSCFVYLLDLFCHLNVIDLLDSSRVILEGLYAMDPIPSSVFPGQLLHLLVGLTGD